LISNKIPFKKIARIGKVEGGGEKEEEEQKS